MARSRTRHAKAAWPTVVAVGGLAMFVAAGLGVLEPLVGPQIEGFLFAISLPVVGFAMWASWPLVVRLSWVVPYAVLWLLNVYVLSAEAVVIGGALLAGVLVLMQTPRFENEWTARVLRRRPYGRITPAIREYALDLTSIDREMRDRIQDHGGEPGAWVELLTTLRGLEQRLSALDPPDPPWRAATDELRITLIAARAALTDSPSADTARAQYGLHLDRYAELRDEAWGSDLRPGVGSSSPDLRIGRRGSADIRAQSARIILVARLDSADALVH